MKKIIFLIIVIVLSYCFDSLTSKNVVAQNVVTKAPITLNQSLFNLASSKIEDLNKTGYWSHTNENGCDYNCRVKQVSANYSWMGENLYKGPCDIVKAMDMFEHSPEHKANLDHNFDNINILISKQKDGNCYMAFEYEVK